MMPNIVNRLWFSVDEPKNEETEISHIESVHQHWLLTTVDKINEKDFPLPIGKVANETQEEEDDEDEEEEVNESDGSETNDEEEDEAEMEVTTNSFERDSPAAASTR